MLEKLLNNVVAKDINHQSVRIDHDLVEHALPVVAIGTRNFLL